MTTRQRRQSVWRPVPGVLDQGDPIENRLAACDVMRRARSDSSPCGTPVSDDDDMTNDAICDERSARPDTADTGRMSGDRAPSERGRGAGRQRRRWVCPSRGRIRPRGGPLWRPRRGLRGVRGTGGLAARPGPAGPGRRGLPRRTARRPPGPVATSPRGRGTTRIAPVRSI